MPILAIVLTTPLIAALMNFLIAVLWSILVEQALLDHIVERLEREIRIDGPAAIADQQRKMMHFARFAGFEHDADFACACRSRIK